MNDGKPADLVGLATTARSGDRQSRDQFLAIARPLTPIFARRDSTPAVEVNFDPGDLASWGRIRCLSNVCTSGPDCECDAKEQS